MTFFPFYFPGISIYGDTFNDENFDIGHSEKGTISMSNRGANTNGSQFFIVFRTMQNLDGRHVAFGQVIDKASLVSCREWKREGCWKGERCWKGGRCWKRERCWKGGRC